MRKQKKICPRCHLEGSGPYQRYVLNAAKKRYEPYSYFAHKSQGKLHWCYLGKNNPTQLSNSVDAVGDVDGCKDKERLSNKTGMSKGVQVWFNAKLVDIVSDVEARKILANGNAVQIAENMIKIRPKWW